jgi:hypothetical protein
MNMKMQTQNPMADGFRSITTIIKIKKKGKKNSCLKVVRFLTLCTLSGTVKWYSYCRKHYDRSPKT